MRITDHHFGHLFLVCCAIVQTSGTFTTTPTNIAVSRDQSAVLNCASSRGAGQVAWYRNTTGVVETVVVGCVVEPGYTSYYTVQPNATLNRCDLVINSVTSELTDGSYACDDIDPDGPAVAYLTSLDSSILSSYSSDFVLDGDALTMSCWISYSGQLAPTFTWTPTNYESISSTNTSGVLNSSIVVTVPPYPGSVLPYTCTLQFDGLLMISDDDLTVPATGLNTSLCARDVKIHGLANKTTVPEGTVLKCSADADPPTQYYWYDGGGTILATGPQFTTAGAGNTEYHLTCMASNNLERCSASTYVEFSTTRTPDTTSSSAWFTASTTPICTCPCDCTNNYRDAAIALGVMFAVCLVCLVVAIIYIVYQSRTLGKLEKSSSSASSSSVPQTFSDTTSQETGSASTPAAAAASTYEQLDLMRPSTSPTVIYQQLSTSQQSRDSAADTASNDAVHLYSNHG